MSDAYQTKKHMSTRDIILTGILLAAGTVIRMFIPKLPVTPNFVISMYCLAILLTRPRLLEAIVIGIIAALLCQLTTGSPVPFLNVLSEPIGCAVCYALVRPRYRLAIKSYSLKPALATLIATLASGLTFVLALSFILMSRGKGAKYVMIVSIVIPTAIANMIIAQICYEPLKRVLRIKDPDFEAVAA
jgi:hypothetical protein